MLLSARRQAHDELRARVLAGVAALRGEPGYAQLLDALAVKSRLAAGPGAVTTVAPDGGVVARAGAVVVDCSLSRLADQAVEALGPAVRRLWAR
jgi:hypothetical protein